MQRAWVKTGIISEKYSSGSLGAGGVDDSGRSIAKARMAGPWDSSKPAIDALMYYKQRPCSCDPAGRLRVWNNEFGHMVQVTVSVPVMPFAGSVSSVGIEITPSSFV